MQRLLSLAALGGVLLTGCNEPSEVAAPEFHSASGAANAADAATRTYEITIENLTTGQPLSPGVVAIHTKQASVFTVGEAASEGVRLIAENGDPSVAEPALAGTPGVNDVVATPRPVGCVGCPGPFASTLTLQLDAAANANRLSLAVMLICTNDGFVGLDGVPLPGGFEPATYDAMGYDAGTEANEETAESLVDPCGAIGPVAIAADGMNTRTATSMPIAPHPGIGGGADLTAAHAWNEPAARVTVRRIR